MRANLFSKGYPTEPTLNKGLLPDPLHPPDGPRVVSPEAWPRAAEQWRTLIVDRLYGSLPPTPELVVSETLCHAIISRLQGQPRCLSYRVHCYGEGKHLSFCVRIFLPQSPGPHPVVINGDGCWWYVTDEVLHSVLASGCALLLFNRTEFAEDKGSIHDNWPTNSHSTRPFPYDENSANRGGLSEFSSDSGSGAISAWAWGYHRCVDLLYQLPFIDSSRIAVAGHSRGAKAALLAGATDSRITLINDNASGAAGSSLFRYVGDGGETLESVRKHYPSWFRRDETVWEEAPPFDQHCLLATLAPRPVLLTFAADDRWSNPEGMVLSVQATSKVYKLLGQPENLTFHLREGIHTHALQDWEALTDFLRWKWMDQDTQRPFNRHPYSHLSKISACVVR